MDQPAGEGVQAEQNLMHFVAVGGPVSTLAMVFCSGEDESTKVQLDLGGPSDKLESESEL